MIYKIRNKALDAECIFERKKWISITGLCNNNCLFCLDKERQDKFHLDPRQIKNEIRFARMEKNTKLILSGGDPLVHPNIIDFVRYGKALGFERIQVITNGRMFASRLFMEKLLDAGLDEVTFSLHAHNEKLHDFLTRAPQSFRQTVKGIRNITSDKRKVIVSADTCITKLNYTFLPDIIKFLVEKAGICEVNLMSLVPQGNAWTYRKEVLVDFRLAMPYVHKCIDYCVANDVVLWLSRFPAEYLEGYEEFIEDPHKLLDEANAKAEMARNNSEPPCKGEKCGFCSLNKICDDLMAINSEKDNEFAVRESDFFETVTLTKHNLPNLNGIVKNSENGKILLKFVAPTARLKDYKGLAPSMTQVIRNLGRVDMPNCFIEGIPPCILYGGRIRNIRGVRLRKVDYSKFNKNSKTDYLSLCQELAYKVKIKRITCKSCSFFKECEGFYLNYARIFGFKEFVPVT